MLLLEDYGAVGEFVFYAVDILLDSEYTSAVGLCDYNQHVSHYQISVEAGMRGG